MDFEPLEEYKLKLKDLSHEKDQSFTKICCPSCNGNIPADNININDKIGKCSDCHIVFPFGNEIQSLLQPAVVTTKQEVLRPEGIDLFYFRDELEISIQQPISQIHQMGAVFSSFFSFLIFKELFDKPNPVGFFIGSIFLLSFLFFLYNLIRYKQARIYINIDDHYLNLYYKPKHFKKNKQFRNDEIDQIYVKGGSKNVDISVNMIVNGVDGQKHIKLIPKLKSLSKARFLEQEIERHLGIPDRVVPEETK